jgi:protein-S-isoprenylcysteine O-methyltransferase Ste14
MKIFALIYFAAMVLQIIIRAPFDQKRRKGKISESRVTSQENLALGLLSLGTLLIPIIYAATHWLDFANYTLPTWAGWLGVLILAASLYVFWRAHVDLGVNWSPSLEIREQHELITRGIYGVIRHPMYASQWLWVIAQPLLLQNWIAGVLNIPLFLIFYKMRVKAEEQLMLEQFGGQYRSYMEQVGGVFPKF